MAANSSLAARLCLEMRVVGFHVWVLEPSEHVATSVLSWAKRACCGGCDSIAFDLPSVGGLIGECEPPSKHPHPPDCECGDSAAW